LGECGCLYQAWKRLGECGCYYITIAEAVKEKEDKPA